MTDRFIAFPIADTDEQEEAEIIFQQMGDRYSLGVCHSIGSGTVELSRDEFHNFVQRLNKIMERELGS